MQNVLNGEDEHLEDDQGHLIERGFTGVLAEQGIENFIQEGQEKKIEVVDRRLGTGRQFNHADLRKLMVNLGIKGAQWGNLPLIQRSEEMGEIICFVKIREHELFIAGIATMDALRNKANQDDDGKKDANNPNKTAFKGIAGLDRRLSLLDKKIILPNLQVSFKLPWF